MNEDEVSPEEQERNDDVDREKAEGLVGGSSHTKDLEEMSPYVIPLRQELVLQTLIWPVTLM